MTRGLPDYLDTSAFLKLVRSEPESGALREEIASGDALVSSALLLVEGRRAAARYGSLALGRARSALTTITLLPLDDVTLESAAELQPAELRSLDALHLAAATSLADGLGRFYRDRPGGGRPCARATSLADGLGRFYCYDACLSNAASVAGLDVRHPA